MDIDQALSLVGEFGRAQKLYVFLLCIIVLPMAFPTLVTFFAAHDPGWRCSASSSNLCQFNESLLPGDEDYDVRCSLSRSDWEFVLPEDYSIVTQFDLSCDREFFILVTSSIFFVGSAVGAVVLGSVSDRYGRKRVLFPTLFVTMTVTALSVLSPNIYVYVLTRFLTGFFAVTVVIQLLVMLTELVGHKYRPITGSSMWMFYSLALVLLGIKAYYIRKWKMLTLACTLPYYFVFAFYTIIPESARWLRVAGRLAEAEKVLMKTAKYNGKPPTAIALSPVKSDSIKVSKGSLLDILWPPEMLLRTLALILGWFGTTMVYFGATYVADDLGGSMYMDFIMSVAVEIPAFLAAAYISNKYGRKMACNPPLYVSAFMFSAIAILPIIPDVEASKLLYGMIGKFSVAMAFAVLNTWSVEIYPTCVRSVAIGAFQMTSRVGATMSPWVAVWLRGFYGWLPYVVLAVVSVLSAVVMHWLPETLNRATPETLGDVLKKKEGNKTAFKELVVKEMIDKEQELSVIVVTNGHTVS